MRIAYLVGTWPNFINTAPVISDRSQIGQRRRMPDGRHALIHTAQPCDRLMSEILLEELGVPSASHATQPAPVMGDHHARHPGRPSGVGHALLARMMTEEINRIVADEFSGYLSLHSEEAKSRTCTPRA
jgi:UDP-N-acetylglucosamine 2-epimerase